MQEKKIRKILLIDDDPAHALMSKRALRPLAEALSVSSVTSLKEAELLLQNAAEAPDLFLVDLNLNNESGLGIFSLRLKLALPNDAPVLILSTSPTLEDMQRSYTAGANCYLIKDNDLARYSQDLLAAVRYFLIS